MVGRLIYEKKTVFPGEEKCKKELRAFPVREGLKGMVQMFLVELKR